MTREEAYNRIDAIIAKYEIDDEYVTIASDKDYDALRMARSSLEQEPCEDVISRQAVLDLAQTIETDDYSGNELIDVVYVEDIKELSSAEKTGHWTHDKCNMCGASRPPLFDNYCPNCGADMRGTENE